MPNWREGSYGGSDDIQETREAVAFAVLTILRPKRYKELFLKNLMENNWVRSGFIGWLGAYGLHYGIKQLGGL